MSEEFVLRVLAVTAAADGREDIWWRTDGEYAPVTFWVLCNDVFYWATADMEPLTPETIGELERAYADVRTATGDASYGATLYCARRRKMRPQRPVYERLDERLRPLFDACGSPRARGDEG